VIVRSESPPRSAGQEDRPGPGLDRRHAQIAGAAPRRGLALAASAACLAGAVLIAVFPGWVIAGF
jgi:hypothetical protein